MQSESFLKRKNYLSEDHPKIIKTIFTVDKSRKYSFDVNQNINIRLLKRMITAAANLGKNLRIFHKGEEFTDREEEILENLFKDQDVIEFDLQLSYSSIEEFDPLLKMKLNRNYCKLHYAKYPYFYCNTCCKSICSECVISNLHKHHDVKEKYDYLQSNLKLNLDGFNDDVINALKAKISVQFFPMWVKMVKAIEEKLMSWIDDFLKSDKDNFSRVKANIVNLKENCAEGLDKWKDEIEIEDMMLDEDIYLTFDRKFKEIENEKNIIKSDFEKYKEYKEQFTMVTETVEKIYNDIYEFLDKYMHDHIYSDIASKIQEHTIDPIDKKKIFYRILSDIKRIPREIRDLHNNVKVNRFPQPEQYEDVNMNVIQEQEWEDNEEDKSKSDNNQNQKDQKVNANKAVHRIHEEEDAMGKKDDNNNNNNNINEGLVISHPWEETAKIKIYFAASNSFKTNTIPENNHILPFFPKDCAWYNYNNELYLTGGKQENNPQISSSSSSSSQFIKYNPITNKLTTLPDLPEPRFGHSMCMDKMNNIYVVGGNSRSIFKFDFNVNKWTKLKITLSTERYHPATFISSSLNLYVFYGIASNGRYITSIEKAKIQGQGECIIVNDNQKIKLAECGVICWEENDKEIYLFGGKNDKGHMIKSSLKFNMDTNLISMMDIILISGACFKQSWIPKLKNGSYGSFCSDKKNSFRRIKLE